ncbi:hypothetical protein I2F17_08490 [Acinetobacter sp. B10A]|uniref:MaoC/PaaZ C-terminal domain-containing protein n=1 Tax=Acinetobacter baretiae TaxID=2605383 RepID=UPI001B3C7E69|nr:MaoC/PaaZ C-terminal domain-containing protein [Acinetobacter baretiae]MBF7685854.1 hypothetical protein [Acinetobacter baretiae]
MKYRHFKKMPKTYLTYPAILKGAFSSKKLITKTLTLPQVTYVVAEHLVSPKRLVQYNQVCGFKNNGYIPAIYFAMQAQTLHMYMMTQEDFPLAVLSLVHEKNQVIQYQKIIANQSYKITCQFGEVIQTKEGVSVEFISKVYDKEALMAKIKSTYFQACSKNLSNQRQCLTPELEIQAQWRVVQSTTRRYACISGDFNVVHLHDWGAKFFGLDRAIAHGMWTQANIMARLNLPEQYDFNVSFLHPLYLGSDVALSLCDQNIKLIDQHTDLIYVSGYLK